MASGVYKITNLKTLKFYIGSSKHIQRRWWEHKHKLKLNIHINKHLQNSWNFYGEENFELTTIENVEDENQLLIREQFYLDTFKPYMREIGYNASDIAGGGDNFTNNPNKEEIREKLRVMFSGENNPMFGREHTESTINKQKEKSVGRFTLDWYVKKHGEYEGKIKYIERRSKLKNRQINYSHDNKRTGIRSGVPMSDENKKRISDGRKRMKSLKIFLLKDIQSDLFTLQQLADKYQTNKVMVLYYKRKLKSDPNLITKFDTVQG